MVLGYDKKRPEKKHYDNFVKKLTDGLIKLDDNKISLMIYGSYARKDFNAGKSDIDAVFILPDKIVTNKKRIRDLSKILNNAFYGNDIVFQVSPLDITIAQDGRFNSYSGAFFNYFKKRLIE